MTKERPILFSAPMVRAILDGCKTQTRRVIEVQPPEGFDRLSTLMDTIDRTERRYIGKQQWVKMADELNIGERHYPFFSCPYGKPGDSLWVHEMMRLRSTIGIKTREIGVVACYVAGGQCFLWDGSANRETISSIHMPRRASGIDLNYTFESNPI